MLTVAETGSTNADLLELARNGAEEGLWLRAERQTAGRGRQGRIWESPPGNLYASTLVRLRPGDPPTPTLAFVAAIALESVTREALRANFGDPYANFGDLCLKWPNDLLLNGAKLAGILLEREADAVVIGFGVNLAHHPDLPDRPTTSLAAHGVPLGPEVFQVRLRGTFANFHSEWRISGPAPILTRWAERGHPPGTPLTAHLPDGAAIEGTFDRLAPDGALILRLADGATRVIHAADVFLV